MDFSRIPEDLGIYSLESTASSDAYVGKAKNDRKRTKNDDKKRARKEHTNKNHNADGNKKKNKKKKKNFP